MAAATLTINVSAADLVKLKDLPAQVEGIINQSQQLLEGVRNGDDPSNAFSGLLGNLSDLASEAKQVPELTALIQPIQDLVAKLPTSALGDLQAIGNAIEGVLGFFGPLKDVMLSGNIEQALRTAVEKVFDQSSGLFEPPAEVNAVHAGLEDFLGLFGAMMNWQTSAPQPEKVVDLLSRAVIGIPHNLLEGAVGQLELALQPLFELPPAGPNLTLWRGAPTSRLGFWRGIHTSFSAGATVNWPQLEISTHAEMGELMSIRAARDQLLSLTLGSLNRIDFQALEAVHLAIQAVPSVNPPQLSAFVDGIKNHLQGILKEFETWQPTPNEMRATVRTLIDSISDYVGESPLGQLRTLLVDFQHRLLLAIESLPFRDLARQAEEKLREIAKALDVIDPNVIRKPIQDFFQQIEGKLHAVSVGAVKDAIQQIWQGVEDALKQVQQMLEDVRNTIGGAIDQLKTMVEQAQPALEQVSQAAISIKTSLDSFDLSQPASVVIDELHKLKEMVAGLDLSMLPGPAVSALNLGANALRAIDLSAEINPQLNEVLTKIDPTPIVQQAAASLEVVTGKLKLLDPASIVANLDAPIDELLKAVGNFGPEQLRKLLHEALKPVEDAIRGLDVEPLFAPLTKILAELTAKVDAILNPDVIFKPLEAAFKPVVDIIDKLEPTNLIHLLDPHADTASSHMQGAVSAPAPIAAAGGLLKDALAPAIQAEDELFGFRPGDMLLPVIDLHHQIAKAFESLDNTILEAAAGLLREALPGRLQALNPANVQARISGGLGAAHAEFDIGSIGTRLRDAEDAYRDSVTSIANAAKGPLAQADAAIAARIIAMLPDLDPLTLLPNPSDSAGVLTATLNIEGNLDLSGMRAAFATLHDLENIIPAGFAAADLSAATIRQAIQALDPAPARIEINQIFDDLGKKIVGLQASFLAGLEEFFLAAENFLLPITPAAIIQLASRLHQALKEQLLALSPQTFKDEVQLIFDVVKRPLTAFDPSIIINELNGLRDQLIETIEGMVAGLLPDPAPFNALIAGLEKFKPSEILAPIVEALQPLSQLIATLDVKLLLEPLLDAIARIRSEVPKVISDIEAALDDVLSAFPEGGPASVSVSATASIG